ncbi:MAG: hypothetical protein IKJ93_01005 [Clostridia bacterium]|nr:hypothetical protein [Clostridia bacterium]
MKFNSSIKRFACLLLALLMLLGVVGCKDKTKKKKKVIKKKVIVVQDDEAGNNIIYLPGNNNNNNNNNNSGNNNFDDGNNNFDDGNNNFDDGNGDNNGNDDNNNDNDVIVTTRPERSLPTAAEAGIVILDDPIVDEFDHVYKNYKFTNKHVIVYGYTEWEDRYEGYKDAKDLGKTPTDKNANAIKYTQENLIAAQDIQTWVKDNYNFNLEVVRDTVYKEQIGNKYTGNEPKIIIGDCLYHTSKLAENKFEVKVVGDDLVFDGGHFALVESAVDWFRSVEVKSGKVACLTSKNKEFKSQITLDGKTYDYIWGDEFDGYEFNDNEKWAQSTFGLERQDDMANIFEDPKFQYVENGKVRLTGDRYYDEGSSVIGYATSGQIDTNSSAVFRNGYFEFYARLPYRRGGFPAIWTMTADAGGLSGANAVPNLNKNDGYGLYRDRVWDLEFDLFESFADADHMTTTIHKWYTPKYTGPNDYNNRTSFGEGNSKNWEDLTLEEERMVAADLANRNGNSEERTNWEYADPTNRAKDWWKACNLHKTDKSGADRCLCYYYVNSKGEKDLQINYNGQEVWICESLANQQIIDIASGEYKLNADGNEIIATKGDLRKFDYNNRKAQAEKLGIEFTEKFEKQEGDETEATLQELISAGYLKAAHVRQKILFNFSENDVVDTFKYRLSPFTNMSNGMNTYAYSFSYTGTPSNRREDPDGMYGDWRWYFDEETINNEYHLYAFKYTSDHCAVYMDGEKFLDFDWDPAYDYKDLDGDGKGDDISRNNNGVGFNFWQYFLVDMMIYTPGNFAIDYARKIQPGDCPFHLYIDYVRFYQDLDDPSQAVHYLNGTGVK